MYLKNCKIFILILLLLESIASNGQSNYTPKQISIQTRWAKDVSSTNALIEYPRPQMIRKKWQNLNGLWDYAITSDSLEKDVKWQGKILVPYPVESSLSGVKKTLLPQNLLWYKRNILKPKIKANERLLLHFGAVDYKATVYLNGKELGTHMGGYTSFSFDVTDALKSGNNNLTVKVYDPTDQGTGPHGKQLLNPSNIYYTASSGIWQTVWLETVPSDHISGLIITPDIDNALININVKSDVATNVKLIIEGKTIETKSNTNTKIKISSPKLWSPDSPFLYDFVVKLGSDEVKSYFGMRKIAIQKDFNGHDRIYLNNKYTFNLGTLDQGFWPDGLYTAPTDAALKFDIVAAKAMGFNTIRKHIKIEPARWYYHADKLGMLVWQDLVNPNQALPEGAKSAFEKESKEILAQLHNYSCITTWVLFNEGWGAYDQARLTKLLKDTDPSRIVNGHSGASIVSGVVEDPVPVITKSINSDMTDVHSYPPPAIPTHIKGKAQVLGEFGGIGVPLSGHLWDDLVPGWGYDGIVTPAKMREQYEVMIDSLVSFEKRGLSASIYTQPFDVESEQNGIITYDREVIKIPIMDLRKMHAKIWPITANYRSVTTGFSAETADAAGTNYNALLQDYRVGKSDSAKMRSLAIYALVQKDHSLASEIANQYLKRVRNPFLSENLRFILKFTHDTRDPWFQFLLKNHKKASDVIGNEAFENVLKNVIFNSEIKKFVEGDKASPNWEDISSSVKKYGALGEAIFLKAKVVHEFNQKNFENFAKSVNTLFIKYPMELSNVELNDYAWVVFENVNNKESLTEAISWIEKLITKQPLVNIIDTYANLLYKTGQTDTAIQWETKAVEMEPNEEVFKETLNKMKLGVKTWPN